MWADWSSNLSQLQEAAVSMIPLIMLYVPALYYKDSANSFLMSIQPEEMGLFRKVSMSEMDIAAAIADWSKASLLAITASFVDRLTLSSRRLRSPCSSQSLCQAIRIDAFEAQTSQYCSELAGRVASRF